MKGRITMSANNIPHPEQESKSEIQLSKTGWAFYDLLSGVRNLYRRERKLQPNGSFFKANTFFIKRLGISRAHFKRIKKIVRDTGLINYTVSRGRGRATYYWILDAPPKLEQEKTEQNELLNGLDPAGVKDTVKLLGKEGALKFWLNRGYKKSEIEACFED